MILGALKYLVKLGSEPFQIGDYYYSDKDLKIVEIPRIETVDVTTIESFADFVNASSVKKKQYVHIQKGTAKLMSKELHYSYRRECYCELNIDPENIDYPSLEGIIRNRIKGILIVI